MPSQETRDLSWLINTFANEMVGVTHAVVVSADGLLIAASEHLPQDRAEQLAAMTSGVMAVTMGAARLMDSDRVRQTVIEMGMGYLLVMTISDGSILAVLAARDADPGAVGYEMARLVGQVREKITPSLRNEMRRAALRAAT